MGSGYTKVKLERRAAGLCMQCGAVRAAVAGSTTTVCGVCKRARNAVQYARLAQKREAALAYKREWNRAARLKRIAARCCADCGEVLRARTLSLGLRHCSRCRARDLATALRYQKRKRMAKGGGWKGDGTPLPLPKAGSVAVVRRLCVGLDVDAFAASDALKKRDREARVGTGGAVVGQTSRVLREAIQQFESCSRSARVRDRGEAAKPARVLLSVTATLAWTQGRGRLFCVTRRCAGET